MRWSDLSSVERNAILGVGFGISAIVGLGVIAYTQRNRIASKIGTVTYEFTPEERVAFVRVAECSRDNIVRGLAWSGQTAVRGAGPKPTPQVLDVLARQLYDHIGIRPPSVPCGETL